MKEELKIKDVMIGDWVDVRNNAAPNTPHLERITPSHFLRDEHWYGVELVPEILEKNGFVEINDDKKWYKMKLLEENDFVGLEKLEDNYWMFGAVVFPNLINQLFFKYVHELQHALKLCEIEKSIEL